MLSLHLTALFLIVSVVTVFIQDHQGISNVAPADAPLRSIPISKAEGGLQLDTTNNFVEARIHDCISNLRFSISPTAFFQVKTLSLRKYLSVEIFFMTILDNLQW